MYSMRARMDTKSVTSAKTVSEMPVALLEQAEVEGGQEMSDIVLGMIIGGVIGVVGSAVVAWIQGHYSLKGKREENLARQQQQSLQIQHEENKELINRIIEARGKYLEHLSEQLGKLQTSVEDFGGKFLSVMVPYLNIGSEGSGTSEMFEKIEGLEEVKIKIEAAKKKELMQQLETLESEISSISSIRKGIYETFFKVTDIKLKKLINDVVGRVFSLQEDYLKIKLDLAKSKDGHDFIYNLSTILKLVPEVSISTGHAHNRIESLLAGADAGGE